jgi:peptidoglycan/xylan/chitin deacetylase (PgdA/CDA1 family)
VEIPRRPPAQYAPLSWAEVRSLEKRGFSFGAHTVTHPILPKTGEAQAVREIVESWSRVRAEVRRPLGLLSYPNGSYGAREIRIAREAGLRASVSTRPAYASSRVVADSIDHRFEIPRFSYPDSLEALLLIASGFRGLRAAMRSGGVGPLAATAAHP